MYPTHKYIDVLAHGHQAHDYKLWIQKEARSVQRRNLERGPLPSTSYKTKTAAYIFFNENLGTSKQSIKTFMILQGGKVELCNDINKVNTMYKKKLTIFY